MASRPADSPKQPNATALTLVVAALLSGCAAGSAVRPEPTAARPKYGADATPLSRDHAYFRQADAPDYWALAPYYTAQQDERSCSVASITMIVNGARTTRALGSEDQLASQPLVLGRSGSEAWQRAVGSLGMGVTLDELAGYAIAALRAYGFASATAEVLHVDLTVASVTMVHDLLVENERSPTDFLVANFDQGSYTGDVHAGHIAPVAAYDAARRRVLVLDPDRRWYEPYWVREEVFVAGLATRDPVSGKSRGLLRIQPEGLGRPSVPLNAPTATLLGGHSPAQVAQAPLPLSPLE